MDDRLLVSCLTRAEAEALAVRYAEYLSGGVAGAAVDLYVRSVDGGRVWGVYRREDDAPAC